jgi:hypothetical protein
MSKLYARIFAKILESSIADDWQVRMVFQDFLLLAEDGTVDMTHRAIARRTNVPLEIVERAISVLEEPDPRSRDRENDGRRIVRLDPHRDWGWQITNFEKYESVRCQNETREVRAARMRHYREKKAAAHPNPPTPPTPPSEGKEVEVDIDIGGNPTRSTTCSTTPRPTNGDEVDPDVEALYQAYPRKVCRGQAIRAIKFALKKERYEVLLDAVRRYALSRRGQDPKYTAHPATWFNGQRWLDEPEKAQEEDPDAWQGHLKYVPRL